MYKDAKFFEKCLQFTFTHRSDKWWKYPYSMDFKSSLVLETSDQGVRVKSSTISNTDAGVGLLRLTLLAKASWPRTTMAFQLMNYDEGAAKD